MTLAADAVLIVEDEFLIAELLVSMVETMGLTVCGTAATADEAAALARHHQPGLVLMDVRLQGVKDGIDAALEIHEQVGSRVIFVTGSQEPSTVARIHEDHPSAVLFKPVSLGLLRKTVQDVIGGGAPPSPVPA